MFTGARLTTTGQTQGDGEQDDGHHVEPVAGGRTHGPGHRRDPDGRAIHRNLPAGSARRRRGEEHDLPMTHDHEHDDLHDRGLGFDLQTLLARPAEPAPLQRRGALKLFAGAGAGLVLVACGGNDTATTTTTALTRPPPPPRGATSTTGGSTWRGVEADPRGDRRARTRATARTAPTC